MNISRGNHLTHGTSRVVFQSPEQAAEGAIPPDGQRINLQPMSDLDLMIAHGWGDTPQERLPKDWRTRIKPPNGNTRSTHPKGNTTKVSIATVSDPAHT